MRRAALGLVLLTACATAPTSYSGTQTSSARPVEADRSTAATLRSITARVHKGESEKVHEELALQAAQSPKDQRLKLYLAWMDAPSEDSWQEINRLSKVNPNDPWMFAALGLIYLQWKGFLPQAEGELDRALAIKPGFVPAEVGLADLARLRGKLPEAKAAYEAVLAKEKDWQEALCGLGLTLRAMGDPAARGVLERALKIDPDDRVAIKALSEIVVAANDKPAALALQQKICELEPRNGAARLTLGKMRLEAGDNEGAAKALESALELAPSAEAARALADAYRALQQPDQEAHALEQLASLEPADPEPLLRVAELLSAERDFEGAEAAMREASARKPEDVSLLVAIARLVEKREDLVAAIGAWRYAKQKGAPGVDAELARLGRVAGLPAHPMSGGVQRLYNEVFSSLRARRAAQPELGGRLRVRVEIGPDQKASEVELLEDTVHDAALSALVYYSFKDATYPNEKPRSVTFEFVLGAAE
jgi:tetratricopeptide (TPR) repeat protein